MRIANVFRRLLGLQALRVTGFEFRADALVLFLDVEPVRQRTLVCGRCRRRHRGGAYDTSPPRLWRHMVASGADSIYMRYMDTVVEARIFWSGGSQAVRLPRTMRLPGAIARLRRRGEKIVIEPVPEADDWDELWKRLVPLKHPIRRWPVGRAEKRRPL
jgi:virulence-associated protein VagC